VLSPGPLLEDSSARRAESLLIDISSRTCQHLPITMAPPVHEEECALEHKDTEWDQSERSQGQDRVDFDSGTTSMRFGSGPFGSEHKAQRTMGTLLGRALAGSLCQNRGFMRLARGM
jgi:hypothetical protein